MSFYVQYPLLWPRDPLHAGHIPGADSGARTVPIHQSTSLVFHDTTEAARLFELKQYGNIYSRISNPTTAVLEERIVSLEGEEALLDRLDDGSVQ